VISCDARYLNNIMKTAFTLIALSMFMFGCGRPGEAQLKKEVVGSWTRDGDFQMTISPDGSFVSHWATTNRTLDYQGTWMIQNGKMVATATNCIARGWTNFERVGTVERYAIIRVDANELVYSNENQIVSFKRE